MDGEDDDEFGNSRAISRGLKTGGNLTDYDLANNTNSNDSKMTKSKGSKRKGASKRE